MFQIISIGQEELHRIEHLWKRLNELHYQDSHYFKEHYRTFTFDNRIKKFHRFDAKDIKIDCVQHETGSLIGYCISTIQHSIGEIDSLFVDESFQGGGIGKLLIESALQWMRARACERIIVSVAEGHESVFGFYKKFGFYPRLVTLELKNEE
ncbi:MAG: GNAT family N-acetyltransferase [Anaerolineaceae bacterium]|nr:GNAT family N-acetyltransferase [Anaerolineaceae bacterium]